MAPPTAASSSQLQPWKAWYQPTELPETELNIVWPSALAGMGWGNAAKCLKRDVNLEDGDRKDDTVMK